MFEISGPLDGWSWKVGHGEQAATLYQSGRKRPSLRPRRQTRNSRKTHLILVTSYILRLMHQRTKKFLLSSGLFYAVAKTMLYVKCIVAASISASNFSSLRIFAYITAMNGKSRSVVYHLSCSLPVPRVTIPCNSRLRPAFDSRNSAKVSSQAGIATRAGTAPINPSYRYQ